MSNFNEADLKFINSKGINIKSIENQINSFKNGFAFANIVKAATLEDGIIKIDDNKLGDFIKIYETSKEKLDITKFVPASGAASRMFKDLFEFNNDLYTKTYEELIKDKKYSDIKTFFDNLNKFAFYEDLFPLVNKISKSDFREFAKTCLNLFLFDSGLNYSNKPKAILKFHKYPNETRLAIEEHFMEAAEYACGKENLAKLHFTISDNHTKLFEYEIEKLKLKYENKFEIKYKVELSYQNQSTDTIAVDKENNPLRKNGKLVFRPAGHGALIENLNNINSDIIFIKNIDNVVTDNKRKPTTTYKKILAGFAINLQNKLFEQIKALDNKNNIKPIIEFATKELNIRFNSDFNNKTIAEQKTYLKEILNRPLRICGVVKNVGEPGGGPFWVNKNGHISLQIVETSEIDTNLDANKNIIQTATHFNPVDIICLIKDYKSEKFNLSLFVDNNAAFISEKSKDGKTIKAMELPGLWNGGMAFWNTIFIEVPLETFSPVKKITDLLRPMHSL